MLFFAGAGVRPAHRERISKSGREPFSTRRKFLATLISQHRRFRQLPRHSCSLMSNMVGAAFAASLMLGTGATPQRRLLEPAAVVTAIPLPSVVGSAYAEPQRTSTAPQLEHQQLVHPTRKDENWTATSGPCMVRMYQLSIRRLYTRVQAPTWTLLRLSARWIYIVSAVGATSPPMTSQAAALDAFAGASRPVTPSIGRLTRK